MRLQKRSFTASSRVTAVRYGTESRSAEARNSSSIFFPERAVASSPSSHRFTYSPTRILATSAERVSRTRSLSFFAFRRRRSIFFFSCFFVVSSFSRRLKTFVSMTTPSMPGGALSEASRTSPAFSPKIARRSRSSGVRSVSPFGVTFPTRMSPAFTRAPIRTIPSSSRFLTDSSLTFGISRVISSAPRLVSRTCNSNSSM